MLSLRELDERETDVLLNYCPSPYQVDEDRLRISMANFIYSFLQSVLVNNIDTSLTVEEIDEMIKQYRNGGRRRLLGPAGYQINDGTDLVIDLCRHTEELLRYVEMRLPYPMDAMMKIYNSMAIEYYGRLRTYRDRITHRYIQMYNEMADADDEIAGATQFLIDYVEMMNQMIPDLYHIHILTAYMVINYYLLSMNYQLFIPMFNIDRIMEIVDDIPRSLMNTKNRYKLTIGNYLLCGLDSTIDTCDRLNL